MMRLDRLLNGCRSPIQFTLSHCCDLLQKICLLVRRWMLTLQFFFPFSFFRPACDCFVCICINVTIGLWLSLHTFHNLVILYSFIVTTLSLTRCPFCSHRTRCEWMEIIFHYVVISHLFFFFFFFIWLISTCLITLVIWFHVICCVTVESV